MISARLQAQTADYLLGQLPPPQEAAFEERVTRDPALRAYLHAQQRALEELVLGMTPQVEPPALVRDRLLGAVAEAAQARAAAGENAVAPGAEGGSAFGRERLSPLPPPLPEAVVRAGPPAAGRAGGAAGWARLLGWAPFAAAAAVVFAALVLGPLVQERGAARQAREQADRESLIQRARIRELSRENAALRDQLRQEGARREQEALALRTQAEGAAKETADLRGQLDQLRREAAAAATAAAGDQNALARLQVGLLRPAAGRAPGGLAGTAGAGGIAVWDPQKQEGLLLVESLPMPRPDQDYQVWVGDAAHPQPLPSGVFHPSRPGSRQALFFVTREPVARASQFMVTLERKGGAAHLTGPVILESARP